MDESRRLRDGDAARVREDLPARRRVRHPRRDAPEELRTSKRYKDVGDFSIDGLSRSASIADFGERPLDIVVHSLANGPEVKKPLLETVAHGYLAAVSVERVLARRDGRAPRPADARRRRRRSRSPTWRASASIPGYGGGMSSAKAALESDTRMLAFEAGRKWGLRVNAISAGPYASRAASAIGIIDKMVRVLRAEHAAPRAAHGRGGRARGGVPRSARSPAASPGRRSTWTRATTRWGWQWKTAGSPVVRWFRGSQRPLKSISAPQFHAECAEELRRRGTQRSGPRTAHGRSMPTPSTPQRTWGRHSALCGAGAWLASAPRPAPPRLRVKYVGRPRLPLPLRRCRALPSPRSGGHA